MEKIKLRTKQIKYLLTSPHFSSTKLLEESVYHSYSSEEDLSYYRELAYAGLLEYEEPVKDSIETISNEMIAAGKATPRVLVIGCGTGREAFALESLPIDIYAMDIVPQMIQTAQKCAEVIESKVKFFSNSFPNLNSFKVMKIESIIWRSLETCCVQMGKFIFTHRLIKSHFLH
jgi:SAM-dependent methyltransferase